MNPSSSTCHVQMNKKKKELTQDTEETPEDQFNKSFTGGDFELVNTSLEPSKIQPQLDEERGA